MAPDATQKRGYRHTHTDRGGRHSEVQDGGKETQKWQVQPARTEEPLTIVTTIIIA